MTTAIILLSTLLIDPLAPDLCADVYLDADNKPITDATGTAVSRFCAQTGADAPVWDGDVCCTFGAPGAQCTGAPPDAACATGKRLYCEFGELLADYSVVCYQPLPETCASGCAGGTVMSPDYIQEDALCCYNGDCYELAIPVEEACPGELSWCWWGYMKEDGTVDCYD